MSRVVPPDFQVLDDVLVAQRLEALQLFEQAIPHFCQ